MATPTTDLSKTTLVCLGAGRQAEHVLSLMEWSGVTPGTVALYDDRLAGQAGPSGIPVLGTLDDGIRAAAAGRLPTVVALGSKTAALRHWLRVAVERAGAPLPSFLHPSVPVAPSARVGAGVLVFPGCVIGPHATVGAGVVMFSGAVIEHDGVIGENAWVAPRAVTSGFVRVGAHSFLGTGSVCTRECVVGERALIGAGATVLGDVPADSIAHGCPARVTGPVRAGMDVPLAADVQQPPVSKWPFLAKWLGPR